MPGRPLASLSLDLDDKWTYLQTRGDERWEEYPSYLSIVVPRVLEILDRRKLPITFFVVGKDASFEVNHPILRSIVEAGHEIGSHSYAHHPWLHLYTDEEIHADLAATEEQIEAAAGVRPIGFRGPGFSVSQGVLRVLAERGYRYDASTLPNILNPLSRAYFFAHANLSPEEKEQRKALFGKASDALRPLNPYRWRTDGRLLTEIPVTTMPLFRVPIHFSYVVYLGTYSPWLARQYFRSALTLCKLTGVQPSLLLHPLDFLGAEDDEDMAFFPGMGMALDKKLRLVEDTIGMLQKGFRVLRMWEHAEEAERGGRLKQVTPRFSHAT